MKKYIIIGLSVIAITLGSLIFLTQRGPMAIPSNTSEDLLPINGEETRYLLFQIFTGGPDPNIPIGDSPQLSSPPSKARLRKYVLDIIEGIGTTGKEGRKIGFIVGPLAFDHTDEELRGLIQNSFEIAEEMEVAVGFHIDDSMFWMRRNDLWNDSKNIEWVDWNGTPHPHRYVNWISATLAPQMCYTSPRIVSEVKHIASEVIGKEITQGLDFLKKRGKANLFAGVISGWETHLADYSYYAKIDKGLGKRMERDGSLQVRIGYCALSNLGYSAQNPPADFDVALNQVVHDYVELWTKELNRAGIPKERIYTHIAFPTHLEKFSSQDIERGIGIKNPSLFALGKHSPFWTAFNKYSRPGFSTYPVSGLFDGIYRALDQNKNPPWASSEGTNIVPGDEPGKTGLTMEGYLAKMFNHGAVITVIFSWGIGGEALKDQNPFRIVTESEEAFAAYRKFLERK